MAQNVRSGSENAPFGRELRRLRTLRGLSLQKLAEGVNYSRGYIGKVETGDKPATAELAQRCDAVLEAHGTLIALVSAEGLPRLAQLPAAAATFVGREQQLHRLTDVLVGEALPGAPRTVTVDGPPGSGKTALALRLAHQIKDRFRDGQLYVDLHGYSLDGRPMRPATVLEEFLVALGLPASTIPVGLDQRAALYRSLLDGKQILLVLDNARDSQQVEPLLPGWGGCGVVVTSRAKLSGLDIRQEQRLTLAPLTEPEAVSLLNVVIGSERAAQEPKAIEKLARHCGHLPLALRIAAEQVTTHPHHTVAELVEELEDENERLDALSTEESTAVRTVFSWSYRDLGGEVARMFRLLGLHRGAHISSRAAASLAGIPAAQARRLLDRLVAVHLLEGIAKDRYRVHDLLRVYAAERALAEEPDAERESAMKRMLDWYLHTAYAANYLLVPQCRNPLLDPPQHPLELEVLSTYDEALSWCEIEMANLVAATRTAIEVGQYGTAWKIPVGCWNYFFLRKRWSLWIAGHEVGLVGARRGRDTYGEAWTLTNLGEAYRELRRFDEARTLFEEALMIRRDIGDDIGEAWTSAALGFLHSDLGRYDEATEFFQKALDIRRVIDTRYSDDQGIIVANRHGQGITVANLGVAYRALRRFDEALDCLQQALDMFTEIDNRHGQAYSWIKIGDTQRELGRTDEALEAYREALTIRREIGDRWGEAETLHSQGQVLLNNGQRAAALESWHQAAAIFDELSDPRAEDVRAQLEQVM